MPYFTPTKPHVANAIFKIWQGQYITISSRRNAEPTAAITIKVSSQPKAWTTRNRTKHRSSTVVSEMLRKTAVTTVIASP